METFNGYKNNTKGPITRCHITVFLKENLSSQATICLSKVKSFSCQRKWQNDRKTPNSNHFTLAFKWEQRPNEGIRRMFEMKKYQFKLKIVNVPIEFVCGFAEIFVCDKLQKRLHSLNCIFYYYWQFRSLAPLIWMMAYFQFFIHSFIHSFINGFVYDSIWSIFWTNAHIQAKVESWRQNASCKTDTAKLSQHLNWEL